MDLTTDRLLGSSAGESLVREIMNEIVAAAAAIGIQLSDGLIDRSIAITRPAGAYRTSMQHDRQLRRPMEIEAIVGRPLRMAREHRVSVPRWEMLHQMLCLLQSPQSDKRLSP